MTNSRHHKDRTRAVRCDDHVVTLAVGNRFDADGATWEIVAFGNLYSYSPSSIGGVTNVFCKVVAGEMTDWWKRWLEPDGTVEWCGDSIALYLFAREVAAR